MTKNQKEKPDKAMLVVSAGFYMLVIIFVLNLNCNGQSDSCSGANPPYPSPPSCTYFAAQDSVSICYDLPASQSSVYFNPFVIASCTNTQRLVYLYDSVCNLINANALGQNSVIAGAHYQVCFIFYCSGSGTGITGSCIFDALPIKLTYFNHTFLHGQQKVILRWATASEINNSHFIVERSSDGINYDLLATLNGAGNSTQATTYIYADEAPLPVNYYRLKQVDYDGRYTYAENIEYVLNKKNPHYKVYDLCGILLREGNKINIWGLKPGLYIVDDGDKRWLSPLMRD